MVVLARQNSLLRIMIQPFEDLFWKFLSITLYTAHDGNDLNKVASCLGRIPKNPSLNSFKHLLQPSRALCPTKPQTFLLAGISQATQDNARRTLISIVAESCLYLSLLGRFCTVRYMAPIAYVVCVNGWNQSTFSESRYE